MSYHSTILWRRPALVSRLTDIEKTLLFEIAISTCIGFIHLDHGGIETTGVDTDVQV